MIDISKSPELIAPAANAPASACSRGFMTTYIPFLLPEMESISTEVGIPTTTTIAKLITPAKIASSIEPIIAQNTAKIAEDKAALINFANR